MGIDALVATTWHQQTPAKTQGLAARPLNLILQQVSTALDRSGELPFDLASPPAHWTNNDLES